MCINAVMSIISPQLFKGALQGITNVQEDPFEYFKEDINPESLRNSQAWSSIFTGISVITNRKTPSHRDGKGHVEWYDLLYSGGYHTKAKFRIPEFETSFAYQPGTVIALAGRVFRHEVMKWEGKDRLCIAHYMRHEVLERLQQQVRDGKWVTIDRYLKVCEKGFRERHWRGFGAEDPNEHVLLQD